MTTTTFTQTVQQVLKFLQPGIIADVFRFLGVDKAFSRVKATFASVTGAATYDITSALLKSKLTALSGITLDANENLPPIGNLCTLRVTAATTATVVGTYILTDSSGTVVSPATSSAVGIAKLSADGTTLTFASADVTAFIIEYYPRLGSTQQAYGTTL